MITSFGRRALYILSAALSLQACSETAREVTQPTQFAVNEFTGELTSVDWNEEARSIVAANSMSAQAAGRLYALLSFAQYAAVMDADAHLDGDGTRQQNGNGLGDGGRSRYELERGAIAGASERLLSTLFPSRSTQLQEKLASAGEAGPGNVHPEFERGVEIGQDAGDELIAWANADRFNLPGTGTPPTDPGYWTPNGAPAGLQLPNVQPYFLTSASQFHPPAPPAFGSAAFNSALAEIIGFSTSPDPAKTAIARKWNYGAGTYTPPGYWNDVAGQLIEAGNLTERAATHVLALMNGAVMDAVIGCWEAKYSYWHIRPSQAAALLGLPAITLPLGLPNHPTYPSGHSCVSSAAAAVLANEFPAVADDLAAQVEEAGRSRMYGGIHYLFDVIAGQNLGRSVAANAIAFDQANGLLSAIR